MPESLNCWGLTCASREFHLTLTQEVSLPPLSLCGARPQACSSTRGGVDSSLGFILCICSMCECEGHSFHPCPQGWVFVPGLEGRRGTVTSVENGSFPLILSLSSPLPHLHSPAKLRFSGMKAMAVFKVKDWVWGPPSTWAPSPCICFMFL